MTRLFRIALATVLATLVLILFGSITRLHTAGAGCGNDWPRCNGQWLPALTTAGLMEYGHRALALSVLLLTISTVVVAFRTAAAKGKIRLLSLLSLGALLLQIGIGGLAALWNAPTAIAVLHLTAAMLFVASAVATLAAIAAAQGSPGWLADLGLGPSPAADRLLATVATLGAGIALLLLVFGASTSTTGAFACATWPPCAPEAGNAQQTAIHLGYRATALLGALATGATALLAYRRRASHTMRSLSLVAVALVVAQTGLNGLGAVMGDPAWLTSPQLLLASLLWVTMIGAALAAWRPQTLPTVPTMPTLAPTPQDGHFGAPPAMPGGMSHTGAMAMATPIAAPGLPTDLSPLFNLRQTIADYVALTKPGIMSLLLTTTFCAMLIAQRGLPPLWLVLVTLLGGVLASGGAGVLNCYIDRDIDGQMSRTRNRAIVAGRVSARAALIYGITLSVAAVLLLGFLVNWTAALLALAGNLFYVLIYTLLLKRSTPYNIVIGGAAGAAPPLVGWAAVTGDLSPLAIGLFLIIFMWTPPHFWALALLKQGEYTRAAVPMLPVVKGEVETRRQILLYTVLLTLVCLALLPFGLGAIYLAGALILNGIFLCYAIQLYRQPSKRIARQMFFYSLWYLAGIFAVAVIDRLLIM